MKKKPEGTIKKERTNNTPTSLSALVRTEKRVHGLTPTLVSLGKNGCSVEIDRWYPCNKLIFPYGRSSNWPCTRETVWKRGILAKSLFIEVEPRRRDS